MLYIFFNFSISEISGIMALE